MGAGSSTIRASSLSIEELQSGLVELAPIEVPVLANVPRHRTTSKAKQSFLNRSGPFGARRLEHSLELYRVSVGFDELISLYEAFCGLSGVEAIMENHIKNELETGMIFALTVWSRA